MKSYIAVPVTSSTSPSGSGPAGPFQDKMVDIMVERNWFRWCGRSQRRCRRIPVRQNIAGSLWYQRRSKAGAIARGGGLDTSNRVFNMAGRDCEEPTEVPRPGDNA
jgi:hypothetical protein